MSSDVNSSAQVVVLCSQITLKVFCTRPRMHSSQICPGDRDIADALSGEWWNQSKVTWPLQERLEALGMAQAVVGVSG